MFTGLVQGLGRIARIAPQDKETRLTITPLFDLAEPRQGESIAVNGACLTAESFIQGGFTAYASAETMSRTNLGFLRQGSLVNLERALAMGDRLGGHLVSGHVDCLATVASISDAGQSRRIRLSFPDAYGPEIIAKGSITLDGVSLTINDCGFDFLEINIIPETWNATILAGWGKGTKVNMETDLIGKYVRRMFEAMKLGIGRTNKEMGGSISEDFLKQHGFF